MSQKTKENDNHQTPTFGAGDGDGDDGDGDEGDDGGGGGGGVALPDQKRAACAHKAQMRRAGSLPGKRKAATDAIIAANAPQHAKMKEKQKKRQRAEKREAATAGAGAQPSPSARKPSTLGRSNKRRRGSKPKFARRRR